VQDGKREGITFSQLIVNRPLVAYTTNATPTIEMWRTRHGEGANAKDCLSYRWASGASYFVDDNVSGALRNAAAIASDLGTGVVNRSQDTIIPFSRFVFVNAASGLVMTRRGGDVIQMPLVSVEAASSMGRVQWWERSGQNEDTRHFLTRGDERFLDVSNFSGAINNPVGAAPWSG
jgi:hypothetical protein